MIVLSLFFVILYRIILKIAKLWLEKEEVKEKRRHDIKEINEKYDGKHIVLVTHSLCARIMLLSFLDSDVKNIYRINQANTALNIIELRDYGPVVMKMNDTTHIINDTKLENSALE